MERTDCGKSILKTVLFMSLLFCLFVAFNKDAYAATKEGKNVSMATAWSSKWHTVSGYQFKSTANSLYYRKDSKSKTRKTAYCYGYVHNGKLYYTTPKTFYVINLKTNKKTKLYSSKNALIMQGITGDKVYLEKHSSTKSIAILVYSISKKKVVSTIKTSSLGKGEIIILGEAGNRIVFSINKIVDLNMNGMVGSTFKRSLYIYNPSTKKSKLISADCHGASIVGSTLYYDKMVNGTTDGTITFSTYRCDLNGGNQKKRKDFVIKNIDDYELTFDSANMFLRVSYNKLEVVGYRSFDNNGKDVILKYNYDKNTFSKSSETGWQGSLRSTKVKPLLW